MKKFFALVFSFVLAATLGGCGGGGGGNSAAYVTQAPEAALVEILDAWKIGGGPNLNLRSLPVSQVATTTPTTATQYGTVSFTDLSGASWTFRIVDIRYESAERAVITTRYDFANIAEGQIEIEFFMVKDQGKWGLDDLSVTEIPEIFVTDTGIQGVVADELTQAPIEGALVYLSGTDYSTRTDATGFYNFSNLPPGNYTVIIARDGYIIKTITGVQVG